MWRFLWWEGGERTEGEGEAQARGRKQRFFAKKRAKNAYESGPGAVSAPKPMSQIIRSFLVLFFKKEPLPL
jgi:hypothetical protein